MRKHKIVVVVMLVALAGVAYLGSGRHAAQIDREAAARTKQLALVGASIVFATCARQNQLAVTVSAALAQQKKLSRLKYLAGQTPADQYQDQQRALNAAIYGLRARNCAAAAAALKDSVK